MSRYFPGWSIGIAEAAQKIQAYARASVILLTKQ